MAMELLTSVFSIIPLWLIWPTLVGIAVYWYLTKNFDYWEKEGVPYVRPLPILGSMAGLFLNPMHDVELERYKEKGLMYGSYEGSRPVLNIADPDVLRDILVKDFQFFTARRRFNVGLPIADNMLPNLIGEDWKRVRALMTPAFTTGKIRRMISIFVDSAKTLTGNFKTASNERIPVNMKSFFGGFTMDIIASSAFATKIDSHNDPNNIFVAHARGAFTNPIPWRFALYFMAPGFMRFFRIAVFSPSATNFFEKVTMKLVEDRKRSKERRNDFLQLMIDAADKEGEKEVDDVFENDTLQEMGHEEGNEAIFKSYQSPKSMSNIELVSQCVIFFLAGYDTTASTLTFISYELAMNPDVQEKLIAEIDQIVKEKGEISYEAIAEMKYLDKVISETLRKYPPAIRGDRLAEEDYHIKDHNITVPKGMLVGFPIYAIHYDPKYYPNPQKFDPERFSPEQKETRHPYTYLPFGAGPRNCVGMRFALMEIKVCLAYVLSQCRFKTCPKTTIPLEFLKGQVLMQPKPVFLNIENRRDAIKI